MSLYSLMPHSDFPPLAVTGVDVEVTRDGGDIALVYRVDGVAQLVVPPRTRPERTDGLWKATCFELFLRRAAASEYIEFNFAPSGTWAVYGFDSYRAGMKNQDVVAPSLRWEGNQLLAIVRHPGLVPGSTVPRDKPSLEQAGGWTSEQVRGDDARWAMALTAVIEETDGRKSYWALAHPPGAPDFHHEACFVATLPAPTRA